MDYTSLIKEIDIPELVKMKRILLVPHGGSRNDTICTVEVKGGKHEAD